MTSLEKPLCPLVLNLISHQSIFSYLFISLLIIAVSSLQCPCIANRQRSASALVSIHEYDVSVEYFEGKRTRFFVVVLRKSGQFIIDQLDFH